MGSVSRHCSKSNFKTWRVLKSWSAPLISTVTLLFITSFVLRRLPVILLRLYSQMRWSWDAGMGQWLECSPPTNVIRARFSALASNVGWVCWFSALHREVFSGYSGFPSLQKPKFDLLFSVTVSPISAPALEGLDTLMKFLSCLPSRSVNIHRNWGE